MTTSKVLRALENPTRVRMLHIIRQYHPRGINQTDLADELGHCSNVLTAHHVGSLLSAGIVRVERAGKSVVYTLNEGSDALDFATKVVKLANRYTRETVTV